MAIYRKCLSHLLSIKNGITIFFQFIIIFIWLNHDNHLLQTHCSRRGSSERPSRLTSAVKPLMEASAEAVIDIKPDLDDDLIGYDPLEQSLTSGHTQALYSRSTAERPRPAVDSSRRTADAYRSTDVTRGQERSGSSYERGYRSSAESSRVSEFRFIETSVQSFSDAAALHLNDCHSAGRICTGNERRPWPVQWSGFTEVMTTAGRRLTIWMRRTMKMRRTMVWPAKCLCHRNLSASTSPSEIMEKTFLK